KGKRERERESEFWFPGASEQEECSIWNAHCCVWVAARASDSAPGYFCAQLRGIPHRRAGQDTTQLTLFEKVHTRTQSKCACLWFQRPSDHRRHRRRGGRASSAAIYG